MSLINIANAQLITFTLQIFTQVIVAYLSDKYVSKYGRRKPFVFVGNVLRYVALIFLAIPPSHDADTLFGWYTAFYSISLIGTAISSNPFTSWMIESTVDDEDYIRLNSICLPFGGIFGAILGLFLIVVSPILCALVCLIGGMVTLLIMLYFIPGKVFRSKEITSNDSITSNLFPNCRVSKDIRNYYLIQWRCFGVWHDDILVVVSRFPSPKSIICHFLRTNCCSSIWNFWNDFYYILQLDIEIY